MEEQDYLNELHKLQEQLESSRPRFNDPISYLRYFQVIRIMHKPSCIQVFAYYPKFREDIIKLLKLGCIGETDNGLEWKKSKQFLAEYFGYQKKESEHNRWEVIENLFNINGLKDSFSYANKNKKSKDYDELYEDLSISI
ncbi:MAG: hypothetical protein LBI03_00650 [Clostridiales bacterium]|jgi:hypothetical protein|nr:hypothetical protein [Clostridiales bacterium]